VNHYTCFESTAHFSPATFTRRQTNISDRTREILTDDCQSLVRVLSMFQSPPPQQQPQNQQVLPSTSSNDGIFWSPAPTHPVQPTSILQRPQQQQPLPQQSSAMNAPGTTSSAAGGGPEFAAGDYSQIFEWVSQLLKGPEGREKALLELSRKREQYDDLALILWHSFGTLPCPSFAVL
jgi:hypothetical protein